jgi:hypothetical protein
MANANGLDAQGVQAPGYGNLGKVATAVGGLRWPPTGTASTTGMEGGSYPPNPYVTGPYARTLGSTSEGSRNAQHQLRAIRPAGLGRLALALGGGSGPRAAPTSKAYDDELGLQSKLAQALAAHRREPGERRGCTTLQADGEEQVQLDGRRPDAMLGNVLTTNGIPTDEAGAVRRLPEDRTTRRPLSPAGGRQRSCGTGSPDWQDKLGAVARSRWAIMQGAITLGGKNIEDVAKANAIGTTEERKGAGDQREAGSHASGPSRIRRQGQLRRTPSTSSAPATT